MNEETKKDTDSIYRPHALEKMSSPEQLDNLLVIVPSRAWLALVCLVILSLIVLAWAFLGSIAIKVQGRGIVMNQEGRLITVQAKVGGTIREIYVKAGEKVKKDQLLADLFDAEEELKLIKARLKVENLTRDLTLLKEEISKEYEAQSIAQESDLEAKKFSIEQLKTKVAELEEEQKSQSKLHNEGLISGTVLRDTNEKLSNAKIELETTKASIATLQYNIAKGYRTEEIKHKEQDLFEAIEAKDLLETKLPYQKVYSPADGTILGLLASQGDLIQPGTSIVWMEYASEAPTSYMIYGFFPVEKGKRILPGQQMQISLSTVESQEYGYLLGTVQEVSDYAVSKDSIAKVIHNKELVDYLAGDVSAVFQVLITPDKNPSTGAYKWTSNKIPPVPITTGTVGNLQAIVKRIRPIYFIIPLDRFQWSE